jgi:hypothetical protein
VALIRKHVSKRSIVERLTVQQHAVHVEDDSTGRRRSGHGRFIGSCAPASFGRDGTETVVRSIGWSEQWDR